LTCLYAAQLDNQLKVSNSLGVNQKGGKGVQEDRYLTALHQCRCAGSRRCRDLRYQRLTVLAAWASKGGKKSSSSYFTPKKLIRQEFQLPLPDSSQAHLLQRYVLEESKFDFKMSLVEVFMFSLGLVDLAAVILILVATAFFALPGIEALAETIQVFQELGR
jgi:hypothetical protein